MRDILVAGMPFRGGIPFDPRQLFEAADRLSCDTTFIGNYAGDLNFL